MGKIKREVILKLFLLVLFFNLTLNLVYAQCSSNILNTEWSEWENTTSCNSYNELNQRRFSIEYDSNNCGAVDNKTSYEYRILTCDNGIINTEPVKNLDNNGNKSSLNFLQFFSFLNNKIVIYSLISLITLMALIILFVLLSKTIFKKKDINELLKEGYRYLENSDIKNAKDIYDKIKRTYDKSGAGGDDPMYMRILEFYDAIMRSSLKTVSFKDNQNNPNLN